MTTGYRLKFLPVGWGDTLVTPTAVRSEFPDRLKFLPVGWGATLVASTAVRSEFRDRWKFLPVWWGVTLVSPTAVRSEFLINLLSFPVCYTCAHHFVPLFPTSNFFLVGLSCPGPCTLLVPEHDSYLGTAPTGGVNSLREFARKYLWNKGNAGENGQRQSSAKTVGNDKCEMPLESLQTGSPVVF